MVYSQPRNIFVKRDVKLTEPPDAEPHVRWCERSAAKAVSYSIGGFYKAQTRKDLRGRVLRKGESQRRSDERYVYTYTDPLGRRKYVYAQDLVTLREKEAQLMKDQMDGLDIYVAGKATVNFVFDRYMSLKSNLKPTTKSNYLYMYDRFLQFFLEQVVALVKCWD